MVNIVDGVPYNGRVNLYLLDRKNNKKHLLFTHNKALASLSELFAQCILGYDVSNDIPRFLDLMAVSGTSSMGSYVSVLVKPVKLTSEYYQQDDDGFYYTHYESIITNKDILSSSLTGNFEIVLTNSDDSSDPNHKLLCSIALPEHEISHYLDNSKSLIVVWELKLCNNFVDNITE